MTITIRAGWRRVFLCLCSFGMHISVVILLINFSCNSSSLQQRSAQRQVEMDQAANLDRQAEQYLNQGRYDEAEPLCQRALAIREKALGPDNPQTATSLDNLAVLYYLQGRYGAAEPLARRALAIREKALVAICRMSD